MDADVAPDYDVIVVGAGPTGLTAANLLGSYGVRTLLVERNATTVQEPRAVSIDDESLRTIQAAGAIDEVLTQVVAGYGSEYLTPGGKVFLKVGPTGRPYGYPRRNAFRQPVLEEQLRRHLGGFGSVETLFGWQVALLRQDDERVTLHLDARDAATRIVRGRYVVAADGASSPLRAMLGLRLDGETFSEKWLIVDLADSPPPSRDTVVFCDARRPCIALPGPDATRRFEFKLVPGDDPEAIVGDEAVRSLLRSHGAASESRVVRRTVYTFHARLASRWSSGRVFLAGDACHLTPPFAGQGMNSGIRDAYNIAWKLAWVVAGRLPPAILASYEAERRDHVGEMIRLALRMGRIMGPRNRLTGFATQSLFRLLGAVPRVRDYFAQMKYKPKPRFTAGLLIPDGRPRRVTAVGRLIPQPRVATDAGARLLDDVLGRGFALIGFAVDAAAVTAAAALPGIAELDPRCVLVGDTAGARDGLTVIGDAAGAIAAGLDAADGRIFLVRPDRYVLGAFAPDDAARFAGGLAALLADQGLNR